MGETLPEGEEYKAENFVKIEKKKPRERTANMAFNVFDGNMLYFCC